MDAGSSQRTIQFSPGYALQAEGPKLTVLRPRIDLLLGLHRGEEALRI